MNLISDILKICLLKNFFAFKLFSVKRKPNAVQIKILMLKRGIRSSDLQKKFKVGHAAISLAISGSRPSLHFKILDYLKSL